MPLRGRQSRTARAGQRPDEVKCLLMLMAPAVTSLRVAAGPAYQSADDDGRDQRGGRMIGRYVEPHMQRDNRLDGFRRLVNQAEPLPILRSVRVS